MEQTQRDILNEIFLSLDQAGEKLLRDAMNNVPGIRQVRVSVNEARNSINEILRQEQGTQRAPHLEGRGHDSR
jgi:hypothetical protein